MFHHATEQATMPGGAPRQGARAAGSARTPAPPTTMNLTAREIYALR